MTPNALEYNTKRYRGAARVCALAIIALTACSTAAPATTPGATVPPRNPANRAGDTAGPAHTGGPSYTDADVRFMRGMIMHHAQALAMTALVPERAGSEGIRLLARRIEISQRGEIGLMQDWLRERGREVPEPDTIPELDTAGEKMSGVAGDAGHRNLMPGMLTHEQMRRLARASGSEFDRLFLTFMIQHHKGALTMVGNLFAAGAAQGPATYNFVSHVDSSQRMEIRRMRSMLEKRTEGDRRR